MAAKHPPQASDPPSGTLPLASSERWPSRPASQQQLAGGGEGSHRHKDATGSPWAAVMPPYTLQGIHPCPKSTITPSSQ
jgi:hypothetical protein